MKRGQARPIKALLLAMTIGMGAVCCLAQVLGQSEMRERHAALRSAEDCWKLVRDPIHPAGPGDWLRLEGSGCAGRKKGEPGNLPENNGAPLVVRAGQRLLVEDHAALVEARVQAVALEPAHPGDLVQARLTAGGAVIRALVLSPVLAVLAPQRRLNP